MYSKSEEKERKVALSKILFTSFPTLFTSIVGVIRTYQDITFNCYWQCFKDVKIEVINIIKITIKYDPC